MLAIFHYCEYFYRRNFNTQAPVINYSYDATAHNSTAVRMMLKQPRSSVLIKVIEEVED